MMLPTEIAMALSEMKLTGRLDEWFIDDRETGALNPRSWFITPPGARTSTKYNRREVEAFLLGASIR